MNAGQDNPGQHNQRNPGRTNPDPDWAPPSPTRSGGSRWGIRAKLIAIFVAIKVVPLLVLAWFAWQGQAWLAERVSGSVVGMVANMRETGETVAATMADAATRALDDGARESMERLTTDVARAVAAFLHDRDADIRAAALTPPDETQYRRFLEARTRRVERHHPWVLAPDGGGWVPGPAATPRYDRPTVLPTLAENGRSFNYRQPDDTGLIEERPLFLEMTFVGLDGRERLKIVTSPLMNPDLVDVSMRENTFVRAETYFAHLKDLKPGEIYVSDVIGAYVPSPVIGPYTPAAAEKRGVPFAPEAAAYAGTENPVGRRFQGLVRWATPVVEGGAVVGWVTLALDHDHIMEFTEHIQPTPDRYTSIYDAQSGNYAFIWDYMGRSIVHPRHYFIVGYDPETGEPAPPWLDQDLYADWRASGQPIAAFLKTAPTFRDQSLNRKGAAEQVRAGTLGLDCRYLNHAPQCSGWMDLTRHGGSGSFEILWSGIWKLTTAAAIPYHTGPYARSPRGFGFVTIGANVDDFHRAATESKKTADAIVAERSAALESQLIAVTDLIARQLDTMARQLTGSTAVMTVFVVGVAIWMASFLTRRITAVVGGIRRFESGDLGHRLPVASGDEMGRLACSFNSMADRVQQSIARLEEAREKAEEASRLKTRFLANVSHELRTPLNGIIGFAELLRDDAVTADARENAEVIERSSRHLLDLVNSILDVAKIESGTLVLAPRPVAVRALIEGAASVHTPTAAAKGLRLTVRVADDVPETITADPTRVQQILHNIVHNAVKFTDSGSVGVDVAALDGAVAITVSDTGPGVPPDHAETIFESFRQIDAFVTRGRDGAGLGLAIARSLVLAMGGRIELRSAMGEGSAFTITLPVEPAMEEANA